VGVSTQTVTGSIILGTRATQAQAFGTPAIFAKTPYTGGRLYELSSEGLAAMVTDGFAVTSRAYLLASSMAAQSPHTDTVLVYGRAALTTNVLNLTPLVTTIGTIYSFTLTYKGVASDISFTVDTATVDAICDSLQALINASPAGVAGITAAGDSGTATKLVLTGGTAGEPVQISNFSLARVKILDVSTDAGIATDLATALSDPNVSFYRFVIDSYSEAENNAAAAWAEANGNMFFAHSADSTNVVDSGGTGVGHDFFAALYNRSVVVHNNDMPGNCAACAVGRQSALDPGTSGYAYKTFAGPSADALTATQLANAAGKNVMVYALDNGTSHTFYGKAASGRALRVQNAIDLIDARVREAVLGVFLSNEYVPMSDEGFAQMQSAVLGVLNRFTIKGRDGFIEPGTISVTVPKASSISDADKVAGKLSSLRFGCVIPNDMLSVKYQGVVSF